MHKQHLVVAGLVSMVVSGVITSASLTIAQEGTPLPPAPAGDMGGGTAPFPPPSDGGGGGTDMQMPQFNDMHMAPGSDGGMPPPSMGDPMRNMMGAPNGMQPMSPDAQEPWRQEGNVWRQGTRWTGTNPGTPEGQMQWRSQGFGEPPPMPMNSGPMGRPFDGGNFQPMGRPFGGEGSYGPRDFGPRMENGHYSPAGDADMETMKQEMRGRMMDEGKKMMMKEFESRTGGIRNMPAEGGRMGGGEGDMMNRGMMRGGMEGVPGMGPGDMGPRFGKDQLAKMKKMLTKLEKQITKLEARVAKYEKQLASAKTEKKQMNAQRKLDRATDELENAQDKYDELSDAIDDAESFAEDEGDTESIEE